MLFLKTGRYIACIKDKIIAGERFLNEPAEGATNPETLRQKDCNNEKNLESSLGFINIEKA